MLGHTLKDLKAKCMRIKQIFESQNSEKWLIKPILTWGIIQSYRTRCFFYPQNPWGYRYILLGRKLSLQTTIVEISSMCQGGMEQAPLIKVLSGVPSLRMAQQIFVYQTSALPSPCKLLSSSLKSQTTSPFLPSLRWDCWVCPGSPIRTWSPNNAHT